MDPNHIYAALFTIAFLGGFVGLLHLSDVLEDKKWERNSQKLALWEKQMHCRVLLCRKGEKSRVWIEDRSFHRCYFTISTKGRFKIIYGESTDTKIVVKPYRLNDYGTVDELGAYFIIEVL